MTLHLDNCSVQPWKYIYIYTLYIKYSVGVNNINVLLSEVDVVSSTSLSRCFCLHDQYIIVCVHNDAPKRVPTVAKDQFYGLMCLLCTALSSGLY